MSRDQREPRMDRLADPGEGCGTQQYAEHGRYDAKSAVSTVAHDRKSLIPIATTDKPVSRVGEAVLVQCPGQNNTGEYGQCCRRPITEAEHLTEQKAKRGNRSNPSTDQREGPGRIREPFGAAHRRHYRDASKKPGRNDEAGEYVADSH